MGVVIYVSSSVVFRCKVLGQGLPIPAFRLACFGWLLARIAMIPVAPSIKPTDGSPSDQSHYCLQVLRIMLLALQCRVFQPQCLATNPSGP